MKSRLQLIVVLLFIGIAGIVFMISHKKTDNSSGLEIVDNVVEENTYSADKDTSEIYSGNLKSDETKVRQSKAAGDKNKEDDLRSIFVHVCGAVKKEGVYELKPEARVVEAIKMAGGFTDKASSSGINQAEKLKDGMQVYIPTKKEIENNRRFQQNLTSLAKGETVSKNSLININTASKEELMQLNGVGEAKALLIINYREANGGFKNITDLMKIKGIKQKFFDKIKDNICV